MPTFLIIIICGAVGGIAPSLLELAAKAQASNMPAGGYYLAMAIFAFLGGFIALIYKEVVTHKAFFLGIGAPALIMAGGNVVDTPADDTRDTSMEISLFSPAYAQDTGAAAIVLAQATGGPSDWAKALQDGNLLVVPFDAKVFGSGELDTQATVKFSTPQGEQSVRLVDADSLSVEFPAQIATPGTKVAIVPDGAESATVEGVVVRLNKGGVDEAWKVHTDPVALPNDGQPVKLSITKRKPFWSGFLDAVGMKRAAEQQTQFSGTVEPLNIGAQDR